MSFRHRNHRRGSHSAWATWARWTSWATQVTASQRGSVENGKRKAQRRRTLPKRPAGELSPRFSGTLRVLAALVVLIAINLYVIYYRSGTSVPDLLKAAALGRQTSTLPGLSGPPGSLPQLPRSRGSIEGVQREGGRVIRLKLFEHTNGTDNGRDGEPTLKEVLSGHGLKENTQAEILTALEKVKTPPLLPDSKLWLYLDGEDRPYGLDLQIAEQFYHVERIPSPRAEVWSAQVRDHQATQKTVLVRGTVGKAGGLSEALVKAGENRVLASLLAEGLAYDIDLPAASRSGDRFQIVVDKVYLGSSFHRYERPSVVQYETPGQVLRAYLFLPKGAEEPAYYTADGEPLRRALRRTALRLAAPSKALPHTGAPGDRSKAHAVDYPAPLESPVLALSDGVVVSAGTSRQSPLPGYFVTLRHGQLETSYANLGRLGRGMIAGHKVRAGQVLGFVGKAEKGAAHLHLLMKQGGKVVDPQKQRTSRDARLSGADLEELGKVVDSYRTLLSGQGTPSAS